MSVAGQQQWLAHLLYINVWVANVGQHCTNQLRIQANQLATSLFYKFLQQHSRAEAIVELLLHPTPGTLARPESAHLDIATHIQQATQAALNHSFAGS